MPDDEQSPQEWLRQVQAALSRVDPADPRRLVADLHDAGLPVPPVRPSLRRPPLAEKVVYRLRVDLRDARPPIWRRLDVRSDLTLDVLHQVLQAAFSWADAHLYRFSLGGGPFTDSSELFLCPFDVEEGEDEGLPVSAVRLDETMQDPGDVLRYVYDYGDSWKLTLRLEEVLPAAADSPAAACVDGRRCAPPEDCGGLTDAADLTLVLDDPELFDVDEVNEALREPYFVLRGAGLHPRLVDLVHRLRFTSVGDELSARLVSLTGPARQPSPEEVPAALRAYSWFLDRADGAGIELTSAGYLRPADVEAACQILPATADWIGKGNREVQTAPLLDFRQSLQAMGLLRKRKGRLLLTRLGAQVRRDPAALWAFLAARLVPAGADAFSEQVALLVLAYAATSSDGSVPLERITEALGHLGWQRSDRSPLRPFDVYGAERSVFDVLDNVAAGPVTRLSRHRLSPMAVALARAALRAPTPG